MDARELLTIAVLVLVALGLATVGIWDTRRRGSQPGSRVSGSRTGGVMGAFDKIFHPAAYEAQQIQQVQAELPALAPTPGDAPNAGRITLTVPPTPQIVVSAALSTDAAGRMLVVRKQGTSVFMNPGGKPEPGETAAETLVRELAEELSVSVPVDALDYLGQFAAAAANEAGHTVVAEVFRAPTLIDAHPAAEIAELRWVTAAEVAATPEHFAPLIHDHLLALLV